MEKQNQKRRDYEPPRIKSQVIEMDNSIAAGSGNVNSPNESGAIQDNWGTSSDNNQSIDW